MEVHTTDGNHMVSYTVRSEDRNQILAWLKNLYQQYPISGYATSHSNIVLEKDTYVVRVARCAHNSHEVTHCCLEQSF